MANVDFGALLHNAKRDNVCAECGDRLHYRPGGRGSLFCSNRCRYRFRDRRRYAENPEAQREKSRRYYAANRERVLERVKAQQRSKRGA